LQNFGDAAKRSTRRRYLFSLFQPRVPSVADPSHLGNFFAPKTQRSAPSCASLSILRRLGDQLSMLAQELAERSLAPGRMYRRIFCASIIFRGVCQLQISGSKPNHLLQIIRR
jgi:hypothetical protein